MEQLKIETPQGYGIFREPNGVGGYRYWSDEIGGGVMVWDTSIVNKDTLLTVIRAEWLREFEELVAGIQEDNK